VLLFNLLKREENAGKPETALERMRQVGQPPLEQHIGVRIPGGQPVLRFYAVLYGSGKCKEVHPLADITYSFEVGFIG
jgi:hypothetical protein